jgi:hypothetical protein
VDNESLGIIRKVWRHAEIAGSVWTPHIYRIGHKAEEKFREGAALSSSNPQFPEMRDSVDWYWTPAVSSSDSRKAKAYSSQRVVWVDCDESYDNALLESLKPSYMWETSPGHKQALWLLSESLPSSEFHRDGFIGMLTQALSGDKSGVDIGQLLRVPGTVHHKRKPFRGRILRRSGQIWHRGQLLARVAKGLGFPAGLASELGADDPYGDRSVVLWKFARHAAELGIEQDLTFKLLKATKWNKWADDPDRLRNDIAKAYDRQPPSKEEAHEEDREEEDEELDPWVVKTVAEFGPTIRKPVNYILPGIIPEGGCGLLVAAPKVGKTRLAIEIALGLATGSSPLGLHIHKSIPTGFFSMEDGEHLFADRLNKGFKTGVERQRFHWEGHIAPGLKWVPPEPMSLFVNFAQIDLTEARDKEKLQEFIEDYQLKLVIIDTLSMAIGHANVSDQTAMNPILKDLRRIARATGCAIMFIHHTRKRVFEKGETVQETVLGATALHAWCDFIMSLVGPVEEGGPLRLGVQTKRGGGQHYIDGRLRIIKQPSSEEVVAPS